MNSELCGPIRSVRAEDNDYPQALVSIEDRPPVLYVKGKWPLPEDVLTIGVVGSRRASRYGREAAMHLAAGLVDRGAIIVSGLALGIDACAHRAALDAEGWTVAVLGHGFGYQYPKENKTLFDEIEKAGTLVTEFSYETPPNSSHFPQRNRIISGLSRGVLVVEAGERSGALITARYAAEQGRDVFAVPGSIFSWQSHGTHRLIKEGARPVTAAADILEEYGFACSQKLLPPPEEGKLTGEQSALLRQLSGVPLSIDELVELTGQPVERLAELLLSLELKGRVLSMPGQRYVARH